MKQVLDKQKVQGTGVMASSGASTSKLESLTRESNVVYLDFAKKQVDELQKLNKAIGDGLGDKGELSKTLKEIKSTFKAGAVTEKVMGLQPKGKPGDLPPPTGMKDFFTLRGFLDKTSILKRGHDQTYLGGLADKALAGREQKGLKAEAEKKDYEERKQQYIADRKATQGTTFGSEKSFAKAFDESEKLQKEIVKNEQSIKGLQERGFKEGQIKRGGFFEKKESLEKDLAKTDTRFSESFGGIKKEDPKKDVKVADPKKPKVVKAADEDDANSTKKKSADIKPIKVESTDSKIKADPNKPKITKAADADDPNSTKKRSNKIKKAEDTDDSELPSNVINFPGKKKDTKSSGLGSADMTEADMENQKKMDEQTELLKQIAENTSPNLKPNDAQPPKEGGGDGGGGGKGFLSKIGESLGKAAKTLLALSAALYITAKAFQEFGKVSWGDVGKGLVAMGALVLSTKFLKENDSWKSLLALGASFYIVSKAFQNFAEVSWGDVGKGLVALGGVVLAAIAIDKVKGNMIAGAAALGILGLVLWGVGAAFKTFSELDWETVGKGIVAIGALGVVGAIAGTAAPLIAAGAGALGLMGAALYIVGEAMQAVGKGFSEMNEGLDKLSNLDGEKLLKVAAGIGAVGLAMAAFGAGQAVAGVGNLVSGFLGAITPGGSPVDQLIKIGESGEGVQKAGSGLTSVGSAMKEFAKVDKNSMEAVNAFPWMKATALAMAGGKMSVVQGGTTVSAGKISSSEPQTGNKVAAQSADSEMAKNAKSSQSSTVIAPMSSVNNNSSSTYAIKPPVRNPNQGVQNQMQKRYGT